MASGACLPIVKPTWSECMKWGMIGTSLCAISFAYSLRSVFNCEIGWKLGGVTGSFPSLGKVTMLADSISSGKVPKDTAELNN